MSPSPVGGADRRREARRSNVAAIGRSEPMPAKTVHRGPGCRYGDGG